jgi:hypothetical protein
LANPQPAFTIIEVFYKKLLSLEMTKPAKMKLHSALGILVAHCLASYGVLLAVMVEALLRAGLDAVLHQGVMISFWLAPLAMVLLPVLSLASGHFVLPILMVVLYAGLFLFLYRWFLRQFPPTVAGIGRMLDWAIFLWIPIIAIGALTKIRVPYFIYAIMGLMTIARLPFQRYRLARIAGRVTEMTEPKKNE